MLGKQSLQHSRKKQTLSRNQDGYINKALSKKTAFIESKCTRTYLPFPLDVELFIRNSGILRGSWGGGGMSKTKEISMKNIGENNLKLQTHKKTSNNKHEQPTLD